MVEKSKAVQAKKAPQSDKPKQSENFVPIGDTSAADLNIRMNKLEGGIEKMRSEHNSIIMGAIFAVVLIVATVAIQIMVANASTTDVQRQQFDDYKRLQEQINDKLSLPQTQTQTQSQPTQPAQKQ
jgi:hypothetical protein